MRNQATLWIAEYINKNSISTDSISKILSIPKEKLIPGTREKLDADEFLRICSYLQIDPKFILSEQGEK
ncbi:MAG: hypothetical protein ACI4C5_10335 [Lachnospiraceae bacterium]